MEDKIFDRIEQVERIKALWQKLTPRQVECLCLRVIGFTQDEIGQVLGIKQHTVSEHLNKIFDILCGEQDENA